jgi:thiol-disulfide isomerase/thioredoxin
MTKTNNMGRKYFILGLLISATFSISFSRDVIIRGNAPSYAGCEIVFNRYTDWITKGEEEIGRCLVDTNGYFIVTLDLEQITFMFSHLGIYKAFLYAEPGKSYEIILPERADKDPEDELNPYFIESRIQLGTADVSDDDINFMIRMFNDAYNPYYNKHIIDFINNDDFSELNADIERLEKPFAGSRNGFFNRYREYRYGLLRHLAYQQKSRSISEEYFRKKPVLFNNPAYMELFSQVYDKYFVFFGMTDKGSRIYDDINTLKSYDDLRKTLLKDNVFYNDTIVDLVILLNIYNEFYSDNFSRNGLLAVLDTLISRTSVDQNRQIGETVKSKITRLLSGYYPPSFELYDADSNIVSLDDFRGKYVYLNFCTSLSYTCLGEFELLKGLYERYKEKLEIVTIDVEEHRAAFTNFQKNKNWEWKFLYYSNQPQILKSYDIRAYPTYFLIGPDGKLIYSPSPSPAENFESLLVKAMKARGDL